jgi:hypothetical protein
MDANRSLKSTRALRARRLVRGACIVLVAIATLWLMRESIRHPAWPAAGDARIPLAVLGDSDSHAYHDTVLLAAPHLRGGPFRRTTYQWTEVIAALRGQEIDLGRWGTWGFQIKVAAVLAALGFEGRTPRKQDHRFNFAISGAECEDLLEGPYRQTEQLLRVMRKDPQRWSRGVVVIRIGVNTIGKISDLDAFAQGGLDARASARIKKCVEDIRRAVSMIRAEHPNTIAVVVGMSDESDGAEGLIRWHDPLSRANIAAVMDAHEEQLRAIVAADPRGAYFSDRVWYSQLWMGLDAPKAGALRSVNLGGPESVIDGVGDHPRYMTLADGHAGTVQNGLWARSLVGLLRSRFGLDVRPIALNEIATLADPEGAFGIASPSLPPN